MSILSFFKNLFGKTEEVTVSIKVTEKPVVVSAPKVEKQKENSKEESTKIIENRLAEIAAEKKVTAKDIKSKASKPVVEKPAAKPVAKKAAPKQVAKPVVEKVAKPKTEKKPSTKKS